MCVSIFPSTSLKSQGSFACGGGGCQFSQENHTWHLACLRSRAALGHMAQHGDPFTTFAVVLEECFLQPASCVMENSMSSTVIPGCHTAVWWANRGQSERGRERGRKRKTAWPLELLQEDYLCSTFQFRGPAGITPWEKSQTNRKSGTHLWGPHWFVACWKVVFGIKGF